MNKYITFICLLIAAACLCSCSSNQGLSPEEKALINEGDGLMRVLTIADHSDSLLLRQSSSMFTDEDLQSAAYEKLAARMVATVTDPSQDGVGIAGPQVGLLRRIVAVQRFDKEGEPFEVYPNINIECIGEPCCEGPEGCLSVPDRRGNVLRHERVLIRYTNPATLQPCEEEVSGFTAVIFQHECDHLDGVLYIDHLQDMSE